MKKLNVKLLRDLKHSLGQFIAITLVIFIGAFFFAGFSTFAGNLNDYANMYFSESNLADLWAYFINVTPTQLDTLKDIEGIEDINGRYITDVNEHLEGLKTTLKLHTLPNDSTINKLTLIEGTLPTNPFEVVIDSDYLATHNYSIGDEITLYLNNDNFNFIIAGSIESSEYAIKSRSTSDFPPNHLEYGIAYTTESTMYDMIGDNFYNQAIITLTPDADIDAVQETLSTYSEEFTYLYSLTRSQNLSYKQFTDEIKQQEEFSKILPIIFFGVAAIIIFLTMSRLIDVQRTQIGIMKALGTKSTNILFHYLNYATFIGVIGGLFGGLMGSFVFPQIFIAQVTAIISLPGFKISLYPAYVIYAIILSILFGWVACYFSCSKILKEKPADAMRVKPAKSVKPILLERNKRFWNKLSYRNKLLFRNIFLNKKRTIFTSVAVICCMALLTLAYGYKGSRSALINKQFTKVYQYDLKATFKEPIQDIDSLNLSQYNMTYNTLAETTVIINNLKGSKDTNLIVTDPNNTLINNYTSDDTLLSLDSSGVIIAERLAEQYNLHVGDTLSLKFINPSFMAKTIDVQISGISVQYLNQEIYCTPELLANNGISCPPTALLMKANSEADLDTIYQAFSQIDNVKTIQYRNEVRDITTSGLQNLFSMIIVIIICAVALSFTAMYNISIINISERTRELATLKVLGYQASNIKGLIFLENIATTVLGIILGLPAGILLYKAILKEFTLDNMVFPVILNFESLINPVLITLIVTLICNLCIRRKITKIQMVESLKSIE